jgi:hypothetical protein
MFYILKEVDFIWEHLKMEFQMDLVYLGIVMVNLIVEIIKMVF